MKLALSYLQPKSLCRQNTVPACAPRSPLLPRDQLLDPPGHGATRNNPGCERGFASSNNVSRKKVGKWLFFLKHWLAPSNGCTGRKGFILHLGNVISTCGFKGEISWRLRIEWVMDSLAPISLLRLNDSTSRSRNNESSWPSTRSCPIVLIRLVPTVRPTNNCDASCRTYPTSINLQFKRKHQKPQTRPKASKSKCFQWDIETLWTTTDHKPLLQNWLKIGSRIFTDHHPGRKRQPCLLPVFHVNLTGISCTVSCTCQVLQQAPPSSEVFLLLASGWW